MIDIRSVACLYSQIPFLDKTVPNLTKTQTLFFFLLFAVPKFAQVNEIIQRHCTPPEIVVTTINRASTTGTSFEIMYRNRFYNVTTFFALNSIFDNSHKITRC